MEIYTKANYDGYMHVMTGPFRVLSLLFLILISAFSSRLWAMGQQDENPPASAADGEIGSFTFIIPRLNNSPPLKTSPGEHELLVLCQLFRGLVSLNPESGEIEPDMAVSWEFLKGGSTLRFYLNESFWSDGTPIRAQDYRDSLIHVLKQGTASRGSAYLTRYIRGAYEYLKGVIPVEELGIRAGADDMLELDFVRTFPYVLKLLAHYSFLLYPPEFFQMESFGFDRLRRVRTSGCTFAGTYGEPEVTEFKLYRKGSSEESGKIFFREVMQAGEGLELYLKGQGDWFSEIPLSRLYDIDYRYDFETVPGFVSYFYFLNTFKAPLDDPGLRERLVKSIDRVYLTDQILRGAQLPAEKLVPPALYSVISHYEGSSGSFSSAPEVFDLPGPAVPVQPLLMIYPSDEGHGVVAGYLADQWSAAGISVEKTPMDWIDFLKAREEGSYHIALGGWSADYDDPMSFLSLFLSAEKRWGGVYANPVYDEYLLKAGDLPDGYERTEILHSAESLLISDHAFIPLYFNGNPQLVDREKWKGAPVLFPGYYTSLKYMHK